MERTTRFIFIAGIIIALLVAILVFNSFLSFNQANNANKTIEGGISKGINPAKGNSSSKIVIIEFSDFQCPACKAAMPIIDAVLNRYDVALYYRNFPLPIHKNSMDAAEAAECANEQGKFWQYHDVLFQNQEKLDRENLKGYVRRLDLNIEQFNACFDSQKYRNEIERDISDGKIAGVGGTPTFFINNRKVEGASLGVFESIIKSEMMANE